MKMCFKCFTSFGTFSVILIGLGLRAETNGQSVRMTLNYKNPISGPEVRPPAV